MTVIERLLAPHRMHIPDSDRLDARLDYAEVNCGKIVDLRYGASVTIESAAPPSHYLIHAVAEGYSTIERRAGTEILSSGNIQITPPGEEIVIRFGASSRHLTACIQREVLEHSIGKQFGKRTGHPLVFADGHRLSGDWVRSWVELLSFITAWEPMASAAGTSVLARQSLSELMMEFIANNCTSGFQVEAPSRRAIPWYVRRACAIIEQDMKAPSDNLSLVTVADLLGVSVRSLQAGFSDHVGKTFRAYVRERRLDLLDQRLREADVSADVTTVMQSCGIGSPGRYAQYYRVRFGHAPSETLRLRKN